MSRSRSDVVAWEVEMGNEAKNSDQAQEKGAGQVQDSTVEKSIVTEEELKKSMDALETILQGSEDGRKKALFEKGMQGSITPDEQAELMRLMAGANEAGVSKSLADSMGADTLKKSVDITPYLDEFHATMTKSLVTVGEQLDKSDRLRQEQIVVLAKGLLDIGRVVAENAVLVKSFGERLGVALQQPAQTRRAVTAAPAGAAPAASLGNTLSKSDVSDILFDMQTKSKDGIAKCGEDLTYAISNWEQFNSLSDAMKAEVAAFRRQNGQAR